MKVINLDKFSVSKRVSIPGTGEFTVRLFTVGDYIDGKNEDIFPENEDPKANVKAMVDFIAYYSDIPHEILLRQGHGMLKALVTIIQGGTVEEDEKGTKGGKGNA